MLNNISWNELKLSWICRCWFVGERLCTLTSVQIKCFTGCFSCTLCFPQEKHCKHILHKQWNSTCNKWLILYYYIIFNCWINMQYVKLDVLNFLVLNGRVRDWILFRMSFRWRRGVVDTDGSVWRGLLQKRCSGWSVT